MDMRCVARGRRSIYLNWTQLVAVLHELPIFRVQNPNSCTVNAVNVKCDALIVGRCHMTTTSKLRDRHCVVFA
jgi:hypothetical protein